MSTFFLIYALLGSITGACARLRLRRFSQAELENQARLDNMPDCFANKDFIAAFMGLLWPVCWAVMFQKFTGPRR